MKNFVFFKCFSIILWNIYLGFPQIWDVYSSVLVELWPPASRPPLPHRQYRLQRGVRREPRQGLPVRAEGDVEAAHQPAVWRSGYAHPLLLHLAWPHPEGGGVPEDGLQLEDEGSPRQLNAQCLLCGIRTCVVCKGKTWSNVNIFFFFRLNFEVFSRLFPPSEYPVCRQAMVLWALHPSVSQYISHPHAAPATTSVLWSSTQSCSSPRLLAESRPSELLQRPSAHVRTLHPWILVWLHWKLTMF